MFCTSKNIDNKNICFFSTYSKEKKVSDTTILYIEELLKYFDKIIVASNNSIINDELNNIFGTNKILTIKVWNEGYDFGMYYKIFKKFQFENIKTLCLANDSCIVINPLEKVLNSFIDFDVDFYGITCSNERQTHLQSYFLMMKKNAIDIFFRYLKKHKIKWKYRKVIKYYEIGLTKHMLQNNIKIGAFYKAPNDFFLNPAYFKIEELINLNCPIVKKNIFTGNYKHNAQKLLAKNNFNMEKNYYINITKKTSTNPNLLAPSIFKN